jgi:YbbR domain-containing protein
MLSLFTRDVKTKLLALAAAFALWVVVNREAEITTTVRVPIEYRNLPEGFEIVSDAPHNVQIQVRGPSARLTPDDIAQLAVLLDCSSVHRSGSRTFNIGRGEIRRPFGIAFDSAVPSQVVLDFERSIARDVPIEPEYAAPPPPGYVIAAYTLNPPRIRIEGPESHVRAISSVQTDPIDLSNIYGRTVIRLPVHLSDPRVRIDSSTPLLVYEVQLRKASPSGKDSASKEN